MDRMILSALIIWVLVLTLFNFGGSSAEIKEPEKEVRASAFFTHDSHMESLDCKDCHHRFENGKNVIEEDEIDGSDAMRCRTCHNEDSSIDAKQAFHRQCITCHRAYKNEGKASGPRTCGTCHPQKMPEDAAALIIER